MAFLEATLEQSYYGQQIINRFTYESTGVPAAVSLSFGLASAMGAIYDAGAVPPAYPPNGMIQTIADMQSDEVIFVSLRVINLYDFEDFYEVPFVNPLTGAQGGSDGMPPNSAYGFRTNVVRRDIRRGTKRFVGVVEGAQAGGEIPSLQLDGILADTATAMTASLTYNDEGNELIYRPVVLGRQRYNPDTGLPDADGRAWRYYPTAAEQSNHVASGIIWQPYSTVRSQNTRQYGRGR